MASFNTGGALGGAATGALTGAKIGALAGPFSAVGAGIGGIAGGLLGGFGGGRGGGNVADQQGQFFPPQPVVIRLPQFDFDEPRLRAFSDFAKQNIESIGAGGLPLFLERFLPTIQSGLQRQLRNQTFGIPGQRELAVIPQIESSAARLGVGPGAAARRTDRALARFSEQAQRIDEFIASESLKGTQQTIRDVGTISASIPQGPPAQAAILEGFSVGGGGQGQVSLAEQIGQSGLLDQIGNLFGGGGGGGVGRGGDFDDRFLSPDDLARQRQLLNGVGLDAPSPIFSDLNDGINFGQFPNIGPSGFGQLTSRIPRSGPIGIGSFLGQNLPFGSGSIFSGPTGASSGFPSGQFGLSVGSAGRSLIDFILGI